jgi:nucleoside diphosphate kinase
MQVKRSLRREDADQFYADSRGKPFHGQLTQFMSSGNVLSR